MKDFTFYRCSEGDRVVLDLLGSEAVLHCGEGEMKALVAGTTDAALEKHVPVCKREGNQLSVEVGAVLHPMTEAHLISFIAVVQGNRIQVVRLTAEDAPKAEFSLQAGPATVYEYCNLHGLWKAEV